MKWIFALNEKSPANPNGDNYETMAAVAVYSAIRNAPSLKPHLIWSGNATPFTERMETLGVKVIMHRLSFERAIDETNRSELWKHTAKGAMLRLDIPSLFTTTDEVLIYTDVDVIFMDDPTKYTLNTELFAFSSEFRFEDFENVNTGVMLLRLDGAQKVFPKFIDWTANNLNWIPDYDQGAIRSYFRGNWDRLNQVMNWKPYWGVGSNPIIVHFHGPKPTDFDPITLQPKFNLTDGNIYQQLYMSNKASYKNFLKLWLSLAHDTFTCI